MDICNINCIEMYAYMSIPQDTGTAEHNGEQHPSNSRRSHQKSFPTEPLSEMTPAFGWNRIYNNSGHAEASTKETYSNSEGAAQCETTFAADIEEDKDLPCDDECLPFFFLDACENYDQPGAQTARLHEG